MVKIKVSEILGKEISESKKYFVDFMYGTISEISSIGDAGAKTYTRFRDSAGKVYTAVTKKCETLKMGSEVEIIKSFFISGTRYIRDDRGNEYSFRILE